MKPSHIPIAILLLIYLFAHVNEILAGEKGIGHDCPACEKRVAISSCCGMSEPVMTGDSCGGEHSAHPVKDDSCCISGICPSVVHRESGTQFPQRLVVSLPAPVCASLASCMPLVGEQRLPVPSPLPRRTVALHLHNCAFLI